MMRYTFLEYPLFFYLAPCSLQVLPSKKCAFQVESKEKERLCYELCVHSHQNYTPSFLRIFRIITKGYSIFTSIAQVLLVQPEAEKHLRPTSR